jgi:hypothetical protein
VRTASAPKRALGLAVFLICCLLSAAASKGAPGSPAPQQRTASPNTDQSANERLFWESVRDSKDPEEFRAYLRKFPDGVFADLARARLKALGGSAPSEATPSKVPAVAPAATPSPNAAGSSKKEEQPARTLFPILKDGKWGYINRDGKVVIPPQFDAANDFSEGLAMIRIGSPETGKRGWIDETGRIIIPPKYELASGFRDGRAIAALGGKEGYIDKVGRVAIELKYDKVKTFSEGLGPVRVGSLWGYVDTTGSMVIEPQFEDVQGFNEGLSAVQVNGRWGFIDKAGRMVIKSDFIWVLSFNNSLALAKTRGDIYEVFVYIDKTGKPVITGLRFPTTFGGEKFEHMIITRAATSFNEGLALVQASYITPDGYSGPAAPLDLVINKQGQVVGQIKAEPDRLSSFSEGLAPVRFNTPFESMGWHYVDKDGKVAMSMVEDNFDEAEPFRGGLARVKVGDKFGYIDRLGHYVWQPTK